MQPFTIRFAQPADLPVLYQLLLELADYERLRDTVQLSEQAFGQALFESPTKIEAILAEVEGQAVGFALFYPVFPTFLGRAGMYLEDLFVRPEYRGWGMGRALLSTVTRIARDRAMGRVEWAVLDWNESAINFYRSLGARPKEGWTIYQLTGAPLEKIAEEAPARPA